MEFNQIRYFLSLADTLNSTEVAMRSGVSQPTLTRAIQRLEQELGGTLVYRDGKDSRLTAHGRDIRSEFAAIAEREQRLRALSLNRVRGRHETLTRGVVDTIAPALIIGFVTHALRQLPMLELVLQIRQAVAEGAGVCMLPERSAIVDGLTLRPVETLNLSRTIAFQSISGSGTAAALRQLRVLIERFVWSEFCGGAGAYGESQVTARPKQNLRPSCRVGFQGMEIPDRLPRKGAPKGYAAAIAQASHSKWAAPARTPVVIETIVSAYWTPSDRVSML